MGGGVGGRRVEGRGEEGRGGGGGREGRGGERREKGGGIGEGKGMWMPGGVFTGRTFMTRALLPVSLFSLPVGREHIAPALHLYSSFSIDPARPPGPLTLPLLPPTPSLSLSYSHPPFPVYAVPHSSPPLRS